MKFTNVVKIFQICSDKCIMSYFSMENTSNSSNYGVLAFRLGFSIIWFLEKKLLEIFKWELYLR